MTTTAGGVGRHQVRGTCCDGHPLSWTSRWSKLKVREATDGGDDVDSRKRQFKEKQVKKTKHKKKHEPCTKTKANCAL